MASGNLVSSSFGIVREGLSWLPATSKLLKGDMDHSVPPKELAVAISGQAISGEAVAKFSLLPASTTRHGCISMGKIRVSRYLVGSKLSFPEPELGRCPLVYGWVGLPNRLG
jgi:hypothetical protein